jgi:hypothetical protein
MVFSFRVTTLYNITGYICIRIIFVRSNKFLSIVCFYMDLVLNPNTKFSRLK